MINLSDSAFHTLFGAAAAEDDCDRYVAEWSSSSLLLGDSESPDIDATELVDTLTSIWDVAHISVKQIRQHTGLSQAAFAQRYCIPKRTVENWETRGGCPDYLRLLLAESLGLFRR